jgi:DNA-binding HxlR family transcriptional regulator
MNLKRQLQVLSKRHSLTIISQLFKRPGHISKLSEELSIPYTTIQQRISELERAGLVKVEDSIDELSKRAIRRVQIVNFRIELSPRIIHFIVTGEDSNLV